MRSGEPGAVAIESMNAVARLDRSEWNRIAQETTVYGSCQWMAFLESDVDKGVRPRYTTLRDDHGDALAGLCLNFVHEPPPGGNFYTPGSLFEEVLPPELHPLSAWSPMVLAGGAGEFRAQVPVRPGAGPDASRRSIAHLAADARAWSSEQGARGLSFLYLPLSEAEAAAEGLGPDSLVIYQDVEMIVMARGGSLSDFVESLPGRRRRHLRREIECFQTPEVECRIDKLPDCVDEVSVLNARLMQKYGHGYDVARSRRYIERQAVCAGDLSLVLRSFVEGQPTGFALYYDFGPGLYGRIVGFDYELANRYEYFNLGFYQPLKLAYELGRTHLHLGLATADAKLARGATPRPLYGVVSYEGVALRSFRDAASAYNRARIGEFVERYGARVVDPVDYETWIPCL